MAGHSNSPGVHEERVDLHQRRAGRHYNPVSASYRMTGLGHV